MELTKQSTVPSGLLLLSVFILIFAYIRWEDVVIQHPDGSPSIRDDVTDKANDRIDRILNKSDFYQLVAKSNGYYLCPLCPPEATTNGKFFLEYNMIYKVGVSMTPNERYTKAQLERWNLEYVVIATGNYAEMLVLETQFMSTYALHPDNELRPKHRKLATPPGSGTRLR